MAWGWQPALAEGVCDGSASCAHALCVCISSPCSELTFQGIKLFSQQKHGQPGKGKKILVKMLFFMFSAGRLRITEGFVLPC